MWETLFKDKELDDNTIVSESPQSKLGESPVWKDGVLYYVDILEGKIYSYDGNIKVLHSDSMIPFIVPCNDGLVFARFNVCHFKNFFKRPTS